jgi:hypothetical protein
LAHSFRGFSPCLLDGTCLGRTPWWQERVEKNLYLIVDTEKGKFRKQPGQDKAPMTLPQ